MTKNSHPSFFCALPGCKKRLTTEQHQRCARYSAAGSGHECAQYCSRYHKERAAASRRRARRAEQRRSEAVA